MLTHRNLVANILQSTAQQPVTADDTLVGVLPLFHIYGLNVVMNAVLRNGATLVTMPRFDLEGFLGLVAGAPRHEGPPRPADRPRAGQEPGRRALRPLEPELVNSGAAPLSAELQQAAARAHRLPRRAGLRDDRVQPGDPRHAARPRPPPARLDRPAGAQHRVPDRRRRHRRGAGRRRGGRGVRARAAGHARLPRRPRGDRRHRRRRRLAAHRRRRPRRRGRLRRARRPRQGAHQVQGLPGGAGRARGGPRRASRRRRGRRRRAARRGGRRGAQGLRRPRRRGDRGGDHGLRRRARGALQEAARARGRRRDPQVAVGQDPAPRAQRARA